jgi:periplasmic protein TonB
VQLPGVDVDHVDTQYRIPRPAISMRLGESGRVMVAIQVGLSGKPLQVQVVKSSGFDRLDDNAVKTVMRWRFRPGTRNGVPEVMWVTQPVDYPVINQE